MGIGGSMGSEMMGSCDGALVLRDFTRGAGSLGGRTGRGGVPGGVNSSPSSCPIACSRSSYSRCLLSSNPSSLSGLIPSSKPSLSPPPSSVLLTSLH